jgi:hypothetical protein
MTTTEFYMGIVACVYEKNVKNVGYLSERSTFVGSGL